MLWNEKNIINVIAFLKKECISLGNTDKHINFINELIITLCLNSINKNKVNAEVDKIINNPTMFLLNEIIVLSKAQKEIITVWYAKVIALEPTTQIENYKLIDINNFSKKLLQ